ncbi:MAG TPA: biotin/lipoyl-binding protein [Gammaproteobacteria bacterium]
MFTRAQLKFILPVLILLAAAGLYQALLGSKIERSKPVLSEKVWQIEVIEARRQTLSPSITLYGRIESPEALKAAAPGGGVVERVLVRDGDRVGSGQMLVKMDRRDFEAALLQAQADLRDIENQIAELRIRHRANLSRLETERELMALAAAEVARLETLKQRQLSADTQLNEAHSELGRSELEVMSRQLEVDSFDVKLQILQARHDRGKAQLDQARLAMDRSSVTAPFDAIVSEVAVSAGDRVLLGQLLVSLFPVAGLEIRAHLPTSYIASVQRALGADQRLEASVAGQPGLGRFSVVRLAGEAEATGIDLFFAIDLPPDQLRPGELLPLIMDLPAVADVYAVPYQAIYGNSRIYRVVDERLEAVDVRTIGQARDASGEVRVLIRSDTILPGDRIAVTHLPNAVSGLKVKTGDG